MVYRSEAAAIRRIEQLKVLGIWPGYFWSGLAGGWVLTYDPGPVFTRGGYDGEVLL